MSVHVITRFCACVSFICVSTSVYFSEQFAYILLFGYLYYMDINRSTVSHISLARDKATIQSQYLRAQKPTKQSTVVPDAHYHIPQQQIIQSFSNQVYIPPVSYTHLDVYKRQLFDEL